MQREGERGAARRECGQGGIERRDNVLIRRIPRYEGRDLRRVGEDLRYQAECVGHAYDVEEVVRLERLRITQGRALLLGAERAVYIDRALEVVDVPQRRVVPYRRDEPGGIELLLAPDGDADQVVRRVAAFLRCKDVGLAPEPADLRHIARAVRPEI